MLRRQPLELEQPLRKQPQQEWQQPDRPPPSLELPPEYPLWTQASQQVRPALERLALLAFPQPAPVLLQLRELLPQAFRLQVEPLLRLPQPSGLGSLLRCLMWKASFRPSRLTSRAEWQRIDSVDTLCPPLDRTDSVNIPSD